jgi:hypothetical protein
VGFGGCGVFCAPALVNASTNKSSGAKADAILFFRMTVTDGYDSWPAGRLSGGILTADKRFTDSIIPTYRSLSLDRQTGSNAQRRR